MSFWYTVVGIPVLFVAAILIAVFAGAGGNSQLASLLASGAGMAGVALGLWSTRGVFRRSRNRMTFYLCEIDAAAYRKIDVWRKVAKGLLIASICVLVIWEPTALAMSYVAMRESRISGVAVTLTLSVVPVAVAILTFYHASASEIVGRD